jgi:hypothetical protein
MTMAKPPLTELTIALDGEVTARDLANAAAAFAMLLDAVSQQEAPDVRVEWVITDLRPGSSVLTAECRAIDPDDRPRVKRVVQAAHRFAAGMEGGKLQPTSHMLRDVERAIRELPHGRLVRVRLESAERDYVLAGPPRIGPFRAEARPTAFGSVRGRVQAMNSHGSLRFTLYDLIEDKGVSCYLREGVDSEEEMLGLWGKIVEVEGRITRDTETGKPIAVRDISQIWAVEDPSWRHAMGAAPGFLGGESAAAIIRRARDE